MGVPVQGSLSMQNAKAQRVFVVDDEPVIASTLAVILERIGFSTVPFTSSEAALLAAATDAPDVLLTDAVMPSLSGVELAMRIKKLCPDCCIVVMSGQASISDLLEHARELGFTFPLLTKPIHPSALIARINKHCSAE
jgi:CheY-like chemotaxis protein